MLLNTRRQFLFQLHSKTPCPSFKAQADLCLITDVQTATSFIPKYQRSDKIRSMISDKREGKFSLFNTDSHPV